MQDIAIIGAGGFARETLDVFDAINLVKPSFNVLGYIVDEQYGVPGKLINDKPILGNMEWFAQHKHVLAICGVGSPELRWRLINRASGYGIGFCTAIHPTAVLTKWIHVGVGTIITAGCVLTNQITIGNHVHLNLDSTVGHDAVIEDFVTISPGVHVSGNVSIRVGAYIGTGANIIEKKTIGTWSIVGAGSTVVSDIPPNVTAIGVPAKVIKMRKEGWHLE